MKNIFSDYGCEITQKNANTFFISYDSGESAGSHLMTHQISIDEAKKAMQSEIDAYEVILECQRREGLA